MNEYFADNLIKSNFANANLHGFEDFWQLDLALVDDINESASGWSSVARFDIGEDNYRKCYYLKRQQNYFFKTPLHPLRGVLSLEKEYHAAQQLSALGISCITPVYFAKRKVGNDWQAILITRDIAPLKAIDYYIENKQLSEHELVEMADFIANLHAKHLRHGALYSKHIYYHPEQGFALIDLENVKRFVFRKAALKREFSRLFKNSGVFSKTLAKQFSHYYFGNKVPDYIQTIIDNK